MVHFITVFASALSLLPFTHGATIDTRECSYTCPATLRDGTGELVYSMKDNNGLLQCYYVIESADPTSYNCPYDLGDGLLTGDGPNCLEMADQDCSG